MIPGRCRACIGLRDQPYRKARRGTKTIDNRLHRHWGTIIHNDDLYGSKSTDIRAQECSQSFVDTSSPVVGRDYNTQSCIAQLISFCDWLMLRPHVWRKNFFSTHDLWLLRSSR